VDFPFPIRKIIHIDMDAYYASVEMRDFPQYRGKPIVVGGSPEGRGVVATASYEARRYGIHSAMPAARAKRLCPHVIFVKPRFEVYREVSHQIREIFYEYTPLVEPLSLDEAYLDVTENLKGMPSASLVAKEIRERIKAKTDLTASAGVAHNKFLAKIASDINKPDGITLIPPEKAEEFIEELEIGDFYGIGKSTEAKMKRLGIYNGADLKQWSEFDLVEHFGKVGRHYYRIVRGIDHREVKPERIRKSIGKERTFSQDIGEPFRMNEELDSLAQKVADRMQDLDAAGKTVTLKLRYDNFDTITRSHTVDRWVHEPQELAYSAKQMLAETEAGRGQRKVRLLGVTVSNLNLDEEDDGLGEQLELPFEEQK
jgi:DNA polymerase-4